MNEIRIGEFPVYEPTGKLNVPWSNVFCMHTGAAHIGMGRFLMRGEHIAKLLRTDATPDNNFRASLFMSSDQILSSGERRIDPGINLRVTVLGFQPVSTQVGDNAPLDLVEVYVADSRCLYTKPIVKAYNYQLQGFPYIGGLPQFNVSTLNAGSEWDWNAMAADLTLPAFGDTAPNTWKPRNVRFNGIPIYHVMDELASDLFLVVGFDWMADANRLPGFPAATPWLATLKWWRPGLAATSNTLLLEPLEKVRIGGHPSVRTKARMPTILSVLFPTYNADDPSDQIFDKFYNSNQPIPDGINPFGEALQIGNYIATVQGESVIAPGVLEIVAADMAHRWDKMFGQGLGTAEYAGIWPFVPDGLIRGIMWISDGHGARTVIRLNNQDDFSPMDDIKRAFETVSNQFVTGLGMTNTSVNPSRKRHVWVPSPGPFCWYKWSEYCHCQILSFPVGESIWEVNSIGGQPLPDDSLCSTDPAAPPPPPYGVWVDDPMNSRHKTMWVQYPGVSCPCFFSPGGLPAGVVPPLPTPPTPYTSPAPCPCCTDCCWTKWGAKCDTFSILGKTWMGKNSGNPGGPVAPADCLTTTKVFTDLGSDPVNQWILDPPATPQTAHCWTQSNDATCTCASSPANVFTGPWEPNLPCGCSKNPLSGILPLVAYPVGVNWISGADGTIAGPCAFLYTFRRPDTNVIVGPVGPQAPVRSNASTTHAVWGLAYQDCTGAWILFWVNEAINTGACTPTPPVVNGGTP